MSSVPFGFLNIDKPLNLTSHDVVNRVRRAFGLRKVGHAGTLDPLATGVLVVCVGGATRLSEYVMHQQKAYRARIMLGKTTTTYDAEGDVVTESDATSITRQRIEDALRAFVGEIQQLPPLYSAIKKDGKKLYELARAGQNVEVEPRTVQIDALSVVEWGNLEFALDVVCGSGTYIRSLAHDLGQAVGAGAYLSGLTRTRSGQFGIGKAVPLGTLETTDTPSDYLIEPKAALRNYPSVRLDADEIEHITYGRRIDIRGETESELAFGYGEDGELIAVLEVRSGMWKPRKVFSNGQ